jgi:hypothetical protein
MATQWRIRARPTTCWPLNTRATKDIDLDWRDLDDELLDVLLDAADHDAGDFFVFSIERSGALADRVAGGQRFRVSASLAGRAFEIFPLDVASRAEPMLAADTLTTPDLLASAGLGPVRVPVLPLERQVAEKLHAYTRTYEGDRPSSRTKDLVDIVLIAELAALDAAKRVGISTDLVAAHAVATELLDPVLDGTIRKGVWDLNGRRWASP